MRAFEITTGDSPVVLGVPHTGMHVPDAIWDRLNDHGRTLSDTDWHMERLVADLHLEVTVVRATAHRYVIDANRDPAGGSLYPGQNTTDLIPSTDFDSLPIWRDGQGPNEQDTTERIAGFHRPYHDALAGEIARIRAKHGVAILMDCHSIRSRIPFLFHGVLPDLSIGTNNGTTCAPEIEARLMAILAGSPYSNVLNGRFKGGWTTRAYGRPVENVHAVQIEIAQSAYLKSEVAPFDYSPEKAGDLRALLAGIIRELEVQARRLKPEA